MFKTIKRLTKMTNKIRESRMNVARRLFHVNFFREIAMKEGILDIQLVYGLIFRYHNAQNCTDGSRSDNRAEGFIKVMARKLRESLGD